MKKIAIIGAGGLGRDIQWIIERINENGFQWDMIGYIDDGIKVGTIINGYPVLGGVEYILQYKTPISLVCAIANVGIRKNIIDQVEKNENVDFPNLIDPSVIKSNLVTMGKGNILCVGNILTVNISIEDFNILNERCTIGHDTYIHSFTTLYPSTTISGCVTINNGVEIGTGTQIIQGKEVGEYSIIGAGSVVIHDIPPRCTAVGSPAKPIKYHE